MKGEIHMKITSVEDLFTDPSIRAIGLIGDPNVGKSNVIYHIIKALQAKYETKMYAYGLRVMFEGIQRINSIEELERLTNSVIFLDEFPSLFSLNNRRQVEKFEESMRKIYHSNNIVVVAGLPHNFNKFLSGLLNAVIYKQSTLIDFIQRSPAERIIASFSPAIGSSIQKGSRMLTMPKDVALIYDGEHYWDVDVPYVQDGDAKRFNLPILTPKPDLSEPQKEALGAWIAGEQD
jgi:ATPase family protein associated with various cellular activities (AAA)